MHRIHATIAASAFALLAMAGATAVPAQAQTEIQWWHAMTGANNEVVEKLAKEFNASQSDYKVVARLQGHLSGDAEAGIAAFRAKQPPAHHPGLRCRHRRHDGRRGAIKPVAEVMTEGRHRVRQEPVSPGHRRLLFEARRHDAVLPLQLVPRRSSTTTRTSSGKPGSTATSRRRPGRKSGRPPGRSRRAAPPPAATPRPGSPGFTWKTSPPGTTCPTRTQRERPRRPDVELKINAPIYVRHFQDTRRPRRRMAPSNMAAAPPRPSRCSCPANAASTPEFLGRPRRHGQVRA